MNDLAVDRDTRGRFAKGNKAATGNPSWRRLAAMRAEVLASIDPNDVREVLDGLRDRALDGDVQAAKEWLTRVLGKPQSPERVADVPTQELATGVKAIAQMSTALLSGTFDGEIPVEAAVKLASVMETHRRILEACDLEERIVRLEARD